MMILLAESCAGRGNNRSRSTDREGSKRGAKAQKATQQKLQSAKQLLRFQSVYPSGKSYWIIARFSSLKAQFWWNEEVPSRNGVRVRIKALRIGPCGTFQCGT